MLAVLLIGVPLGMVGALIGNTFVFNFGAVVFEVFGFIGWCMGLFHFIGRITGRYRGIKSRPWREQVW